MLFDMFLSCSENYCIVRKDGFVEVKRRQIKKSGNAFVLRQAYLETRAKHGKQPQMTEECFSVLRRRNDQPRSNIQENKWNKLY